MAGETQRIIEAISALRSDLSRQISNSTPDLSRIEAKLSSLDVQLDNLQSSVLDMISEQTKIMAQLDALTTAVENIDPSITVQDFQF